MKIWICIPVYNRIEYTKNCVNSLLVQDYKNFTIVICDDGSTDGTAEYIQQNYPEIILLHGDGSLWWSGATNLCIKYVMQYSNKLTDYILTLNNDLEVPSNYLSTLSTATKKRPKALITSAGYDIKTRKLVDPGYRQSWLTTKSIAVDPMYGHLSDDKSMASVTHAAGRGTLIPLELFFKIGLFDELHLPQYGADYDFSFRAVRAGYPVYVSFLSIVYYYIEETGMTKIRESFTIKGLWRYLTDIKSPAKLKTRWWVAVKNCPKMLLPTFLILDLLFIIGSYFKYHLLPKKI